MLSNTDRSNHADESSGNYFKFKSLVFYGLVIGIIGAVFGIAFFRDAYYIYSVICLCYSAFKFLQMAVIQGYVNLKLSSSLAKYEKRREDKSQKFHQEITHVFIVPSFNQDIQILKQTLSNLASHSRAQNYCVLLAMQKHQIGSESKAKILVEQFQMKFKLISYTIHELQQGQAKGKPGNINWCARHLPQKIKQKFIDLNSVMITVMDADSFAPQPYIDLVQEHIERNYDNRQKYIYQAPQIFYRNHNEAAFFVDIIDNFMSYMQCSQFVSILGFTMGVSNYTISYKLLQKIDFWDTCKYSKCQDVRTPCKAFWKTNGQTQTVPIYIPFNKLNLKTGQGYWADFVARITQAKRHSQAQIQLSYNLSNFIKNPRGNILKKMNICYIMFELYFIILVVFPTSLVVILLQQTLQLLPMSDLDSGYTLHISNFVNTILLVIGLSLFQLFKRKAAKQVYGICTPFRLLKFLRFFPLYFPLALTFGYFPSVMASYHLHNDNIMFNVTPKVFSKSKDQCSQSNIATHPIQYKNNLEKNENWEQSESVQKIQSDNV